MTQQFKERFITDSGELTTLSELPLDAWLSKQRDAPEFHAPNTALWRGYLGTWQIINDRLHLVALEGYLKEDSSQSSNCLELLFPGQPERVFADWFSGVLTIKLSQSKDTANGHTERVELVTVKSGVVVVRHEKVRVVESLWPKGEPLQVPSWLTR